VNYTHETWTLSVGDINNLRDFGRQIVSNIFGRIQCKKGWRIKSNKELKKLMKGRDIVKYMKVQKKMLETSQQNGRYKTSLRRSLIGTPKE
jgi:hypothetical protein